MPITQIFDAQLFAEVFFSCELGSLFDQRDVSESDRRYALIVPTRRRNIAFLTERIDEITNCAAEIRPLGALLASCLAHPWFLGAMICDNHPLLVLDLHRIAQDVLRQHIVGLKL